MKNLQKLANDFKSELDRLDADPDTLSSDQVDPEFWETQDDSDELYTGEEPLKPLYKFPITDNGVSAVLDEFWKLSKEQQDEFIAKIWKARRQAK